MHGTVRMRVELEGETIVRADPEIGFLHRGFQKSCENVTWNQCLPYTDRLNYVSAIMNNLGFLKAVEKLVGLEIPERAQYIRVAASELHRMHDHLTCVGAIGLELGGFSAFLYAIEGRELIMDRVSELTGARLTTTFGRVGGLNRDLPDGWIDRVHKTLDKIHELLGEVDGLLTAQPHLRGPHARHRRHHRAGRAGLRLYRPLPPRQRHQLRRPQGAAVLGLRPDEFRRPGGPERRQLRPLPDADGGAEAVRGIVRQALKECPTGPVIVDDWRVALPPKAEVYGTIEGVISHFKLVMEGVPGAAGRGLRLHRGGQRRAGLVPGERRLPAGRTRSTSARPGFAILSGVPRMIEGRMLADLIPTFDTINMIGGEVEQ